MRINFKYFPLLILLFTFCSCYTTVFQFMGVMDKSPSLKSMTNPQKEIIFIPMHHIGKQAFYSNVKKQVDSLRNIGYSIYFEGVKFSRLNDSLVNDTLSMKLRKLIGVDFRSMKSNGGYIDTVNNTFMGKKVKAIKRHKLVNQPKSYNFFDTSVDRRVDVYLSDALNAFENKYKLIILNACDFSTKPGEKYQCGNIKGDKKFVTRQYRNEFIATEIVKDSHNKIVLVYGAKHYKGILKELQLKDSTWKRH
ncbi:MAG: hypothetical protein ABJB05_14225 [Parafilimonas sp.]